MLLFLIALASPVVSVIYLSVLLYKRHKAKKNKKKIILIKSIIDISMDGIDFDCGVKQYQLN